MAHWPKAECAHNTDKFFCALLSHNKTGGASEQGRRRERLVEGKSVKEQREDERSNTNHTETVEEMSFTVSCCLLLLQLLSLWRRHSACMCLRQTQWANEGRIMPLTHSLVPQGWMDGRERRGGVRRRITRLRGLIATVSLERKCKNSTDRNTKQDF